MVGGYLVSQLYQRLFELAQATQSVTTSQDEQSNSLTLLKYDPFTKPIMVESSTNFNVMNRLAVIGKRAQQFFENQSGQLKQLQKALYNLPVPASARQLVGSLKSVKTPLLKHILEDSRITAQSLQQTISVSNWRFHFPYWQLMIVAFVHSRTLRPLSRPSLPPLQQIRMKRRKIRAKRGGVVGHLCSLLMW